jgi:hypothetical protein
VETDCDTYLRERLDMLSTRLGVARHDIGTT